MRAEILVPSSIKHPVLGQAVREKRLVQVMGHLWNPWTWIVLGHEVAHLLLPRLWSGKKVWGPSGLRYVSAWDRMGYVVEEALAFLLVPLGLVVLTLAWVTGRARVSIIRNKEVQHV